MLPNVKELTVAVIPEDLNVIFSPILNLLEFRYTKFTFVDVFVCDVKFGSTFATAFEVAPTISSPEIVSVSVLVLLETVTVGVTGVDKL